MAVVTKTVDTVNVILQDAMNGDITFKIDNPIDDISMSEIKGAFANVIDIAILGGDNENLLCTKNGYDIVAVVGAERVKVVTTREPLE